MNGEEKILTLLGEIKTDIDGVKADIDGIKADLKHNSRRLDKYEMQQSNIYTSVKAQTLGVKMLETDMFKLREESNMHFDALREDVSALKEDVSVLKEDVSELKEDVSGLREDIVDIKDDLDELKEHAEVTRSTSNKLAEWADRVDDKIDVPLLKFS